MQAIHEEWRSVAKYEGMYEVSNCGRVRSLDRVDFAGRQRKGRILKSNNDTYLGVNLVKNGRSRFVRIANLVADAFLGPRPVGHEIHHKDADTHNNRADNLEYVTPKKNKEHSTVAGRGRFSVDEARAIFAAYRDGTSVKSIASLYGVNPSTIAGMLSGRSYSAFLANYPELAPRTLLGFRKLSEIMVREIRDKYKLGGQSCYTLATEYDVHPTTIHKIVTGARRQAVKNE